MRSSPRTTTPRRPGSSRSWSPTRLRAKNATGAETAAYGALLAHFSAVKAGEVDQDHRLRGRGRAAGPEARRGEVHHQVPPQPQRPHGQVQHRPRLLRRRRFERSSQLFTAFALAHPTQKDAPVAGKPPSTGSASSTTSRASRRRRGSSSPTGSCPPRSSPTSASSRRRARPRRWASSRCRARPRPATWSRASSRWPRRTRAATSRRRRSTAHSPPPARRRTTPRNGRSARSSSPTTRRRPTPPTCSPPSPGTRPRRGASPRPPSGTSSSGSGWARTAPPTTGGWPPVGCGWCSTTTRVRRRTSRPRPTWAATAGERRWPSSPQSKLKARDLAGAKATATQALGVDKTNPQAAAVLAEVAATPG